MWNALHIHIQRLPFSFDVNSEKPMMLWESKLKVTSAWICDTVCNSSFTSENWDKNYFHACVYCIFRTVKILNRYNLSGQLKRAQHSDSNTCEKAKFDF